jgi:O-antigen chain-terminating methyltransferase
MTDQTPRLDPAALDEIESLVREVGRRSVIEVGGEPGAVSDRSAAEWSARAMGEAALITTQPRGGRLRKLRRAAVKFVEPAFASAAEAARANARSTEALAHEVQEERQRADVLAARLAALESAAVGAAPAAAPSPGLSPQAAAPALDPAWYAAFEQRFRGQPSEIRVTLAHHLDRIVPAAEAGGLVLDIGSGRGEWLELLREHGVTAYGVDSSEVFARQAADAGLQVVHGDALDHLAAVPPGSLAAVTAFHFAEHLPLAALITFVERAVAALRPGGVLLLETPNPTNVVVGAAAFWMDPTHVRPLHPLLLSFILEQAGLEEVALDYLHPAEEYLPDEDAHGGRLAWALAGPQDYAVSGRRPGP